MATKLALHSLTDRVLLVSSSHHELDFSLASTLILLFPKVVSNKALQAM